MFDLVIHCPIYFLLFKCFTLWCVTINILRNHSWQTVWYDDVDNFLFLLRKIDDHTLLVVLCNSNFSCSTFIYTSHTMSNKKLSSPNVWTYTFLIDIRQCVLWPLWPTEVPFDVLTLWLHHSLSEKWRKVRKPKYVYIVH